LKSKPRTLFKVVTHPVEPRRPAEPNLVRKTYKPKINRQRFEKRSVERASLAGPTIVFQQALKN
jgi:hypothetical protein